MWAPYILVPALCCLTFPTPSTFPWHDSANNIVYTVRSLHLSTMGLPVWVLNSPSLDVWSHQSVSFPIPSHPQKVLTTTSWVYGIKIINLLLPWWRRMPRVLRDTPPRDERWQCQMKDLQRGHRQGNEDETVSLCEVTPLVSVITADLQVLVSWLFSLPFKRFKSCEGIPMRLISMKYIENWVYL